jgi:spore coat polysaccharide biosynthesis protein SpsF (cytidylyltransferase family)
MKILGIIQARLDSTRLPEKVLLKIQGKTILEHIISRVKCSKYINQIVVATTINKSEDVLVDFIKTNSLCDVFRGSVDNVLERFFLCAKKYNADIIVRITADDPIKDSEIIDIAVKKILDNEKLDYCSNTVKPTYPEGLDIEVFRFSALLKTYNEAKLKSEQEHVTPYIWKHPEIFNIENFEYKENLSSWRWTLDKSEDFEFMKIIYKNLYDKNKIFSYKDVIKFIKSNPEVLKINSGTIRNEGYLKSINEELNNGNKK